MSETHARPCRRRLGPRSVGGRTVLGTCAGGRTTIDNKTEAGPRCVVPKMIAPGRGA